MNRHLDVDELRRSAEAFLQDVIAQSSGNTRKALASSIADLAFAEPGNPVKALFAAAYSKDTTSSTLKPAEPPKVLRLPSRERKSPLKEPKSNTLSPEESADTPFNNEVVKSGAVQLNSSFPTAERANRVATQYCCIFCRDNLSSKGVCKRHLEDQHVAPKVFQCENCSLRFNQKAEAKKHCEVCGKGIFAFVVVRPEAKRIYGCEYSGLRFNSLSKYLEHLLKLCEKSNLQTRPHRSLHRKLYALLGQPELQEQCEDISLRLHGARQAWKTLRWTDPQLRKAIDSLEYAVLKGDGTIDFADAQKPQSIRLFLNSLLCAAQSEQSESGRRAAQGSEKKSSSERPRRAASASSTLSRITTPQASLRSPTSPTYAVATAIPQDVKTKRHLSDCSWFYLENRPAPGPPKTPSISRYPIDTNMQYSQQPVLPVTVALPSAFEPHDTTFMGGMPTENDLDWAYAHEGLAAPNLSITNPPHEPTLASYYPEAEAQPPIQFGYTFWPTPDYSFPFNSHYEYTWPPADHFAPNQPTTRMSSVATEQTLVDVNDDDQRQTFLFDDDS